MRILRMSANFGCLEHAVLKLQPGMNVLCLPNEGGKSTWSAFLRVMLYGLNTRERDKKGFLADKTRFQPWSGGQMEGELLCLWQGKNILIRRYTKGQTPMGVCEITYADSGDPVPGLTGDNLGDVLIGVSRSVFERSAFLSQAGLAVTQTPELEKRLAALVSSGEEGVSASQVKETLTDWQRMRQYRSRGAIPTLEARRGELTETLKTISDMTSQIRQSRLKLDQLEDARAKVKHQIDLYAVKRENDQAQAYLRAETELAQARDQVEKLEAKLPREGSFPEKAELEQGRDAVAYLRSLDQNLKTAEKQIPPAQAALDSAKTAADDPVFSGTAEDVRARVRASVEQGEALEQRSAKKGRMAVLWPVLGALATSLAFGGVFLMLKRLEPISFAAFALLALGIVLGVVSAQGKRKLLGQRAALWSALGAASPQEAVERGEDYCRRLEAAQRAQSELERVQDGTRELSEERERCWNQLRDLVGTFAPEVKDVFGFSAAITRALTLLDAIATAHTRVDSAQTLFETVSVHGTGCAGVVGEEPAMPLEQAQELLRQADQRISALQDDRATAQGRRSALGDEDAVEAEIEGIDRALAAHRRDYEALGLALEGLELADREMRERFSPELNRLAGAYLTRLTGGKYAAVRLNRELDAGAEEQGSLVTRDVLALSRGTADQLWLAVRLAVCDLALPGDDACPLVLDDALANFDDARARLALEELERLSEKRQILLFSCHTREQTIFQNRA